MYSQCYAGSHVTNENTVAWFQKTYGVLMIEDFKNFLVI